MPPRSPFVLMVVMVVMASCCCKSLGAELSITSVFPLNLPSPVFKKHNPLIHFRISWACALFLRASTVDIILLETFVFIELG